MSVTMYSWTAEVCILILPYTLVAVMLDIAQEPKMVPSEALAKVRKCHAFTQYIVCEPKLGLHHVHFCKRLN
ncbi:MAG: hypothetical protein DDT30_01628 [Dehalococcoidia bacterium]|nr:hypothetical protein [Bacillota bacterium]